MHSDEHDLADDLEELLWHINTEMDHLVIFQKKITTPAAATPPETLLVLQKIIHEQQASYTILHTELCAMRTGGTMTLEIKNRAFSTLRTLQGITGSILAAADWQSPSYAHTKFSQAGAHTGKITGTINDYKRDQHLDAELFEKKFAHAYIDSSLRISPLTFVTSSGMAAFTTILVHLQLDGLAQGTIVAGRNTYFEAKHILETTFKKNLYYVDEMNVKNLCDTVLKIKPSVIFLDTLCNTETVAMPDMKKIIIRLAKEITQPTILVLDNTGRGIMYQPLADLPHFNKKLQIIVFESLMKYHQFGFDRVTGGIMWTTEFFKYKLHLWRMRLGTNMPDASVLSLPKPHRKLLETRMMRMNRNALFLARALETHITQSPHSKFSGVVYPGLISYPGYLWTQHEKFHGSFLILKAKKPSAAISLYKKYIVCAIAEGKKQKINLVAGTSFGFNTTRIYLTALHADKHTTPFLRISVGTETQSELEKTARVFITALNSL